MKREECNICFEIKNIYSKCCTFNTCSKCLLKLKKPKCPQCEEYFGTYYSEERVLFKTYRLDTESGVYIEPKSKCCNILKYILVTPFIICIICIIIILAPFERFIFKNSEWFIKILKYISSFYEKML